MTKRQRTNLTGFSSSTKLILYTTCVFTLTSLYHQTAKVVGSRQHDDALETVTPPRSTESLLFVPRSFHKHNLLVLVRANGPCWQIESLRRDLEESNTPALIAVEHDLRDKTSDDDGCWTGNDVIRVPLQQGSSNENSFWTMVHKQLHQSVKRSGDHHTHNNFVLNRLVDWVIQIDLNYQLDARRLKDYLLTQESGKTPFLLRSSNSTKATTTALHSDILNSRDNEKRPLTSSSLVTTLENSKLDRNNNELLRTGVVFPYTVSRRIGSGEENWAHTQQIRIQESADLLSESVHSCHNNHHRLAVRRCRQWTNLIEPARPRHTSSVHTIVTAYFLVHAKHTPDEYAQWMSNMLSIQDPVVVYTSPDLVPRIEQLRRHAPNRTMIVPMELTDLPLSHTINKSVWEAQLDMDPEKETHRDYRVFWIWLSKSWWVMETMRLNPFGSKLFMWCDIGSFRYPRDRKRFSGKLVVQHPELVPEHSILQMNHHVVRHHPSVWFTEKKRRFFFHSGSQAIGYATTWKRFHAALHRTMRHFLRRGLFIGEDQMVMQDTCLQNNDLCVYASHTEVDDDKYFGLKHLLHFGGDHWYKKTPTLEAWDGFSNRTVNINS